MVDRIRYELKLAWKTMIVVPITVLCIVALFALLQHIVHQSAARTLLAEIEMFLPLAAGIVAGAIVSRDAALELHLTMPKSYHTTSMLRLFILFCWVACLALLCVVSCASLGILSVPTFTHAWPLYIQLLTLQLLWLAPLLWFIAVGLCLAVLTQSRTACTTLLGCIWFLNVLFALTIVNISWLRPVLFFPAVLILYPALHVSQSAFNTYWLTTRFELVGTALVLFLLSWLLLHDTERLLKGATEE